MAERTHARVALVTGGASGIGRAAALAFARVGAAVAVADLDEEGGRETVRLICDAGGRAAFFKVDVAEEADVAAMVAGVWNAHGRLDWAFNNAGSSGRGIGGGGRALVADYPRERWDRVIAVNLTGVWLCLREEIRHMLRQGGGSIVNTSSIAGLIGVGGRSAYVAAKHGVVGLTRAAAVEYGRQGVRVNCVCPGYIETPMTAAAMADPAELALMTGSAPEGRMGKPDEVAAAVVWLCSEAAAFVTGHALSVDGGYVAQ